MHMQRSVHARTKGTLLDILAEEGVLVDETPVDRNVTWYYVGPWSLATTPMPGVAGHLTWNAAPADAAEAEALKDLLARLAARGILHQGQDQAAHMVGTAGDPQRHDDHTRIGLLRDAHARSCGVQVRGAWYHTDLVSLIYHGQNEHLAREMLAAGSPGTTPLPDPDDPTRPLAWKTMGGGYTVITLDIAVEIAAAIKVCVARHFKVGEAARAALAAGTLTDVNAIEWPAGYGDQ